MNRRLILRTLLSALAAFALAGSAWAKTSPKPAKGITPKTDKKAGSNPKADKKGCPPANWVKKGSLPASVPASLRSNAEYLGVTYSATDLAKPAFTSLASQCGAVVSGRVAYNPKSGGVYQAYLFKVKKPFKVYRLWSSHRHDKGGTFPPEKFGSWWSATKPAGLISKYREQNAICRAWNVFEHEVECEVRAGVILAAGPGNSVGTAKICPSGDSYKIQPRVWQLYFDTYKKGDGALMQTVFQKCTTANVGATLDKLTAFSATNTRFTRRLREDGKPGTEGGKDTAPVTTGKPKPPKKGKGR